MIYMIYMIVLPVWYQTFGPVFLKQYINLFT